MPARLGSSAHVRTLARWVRLGELGGALVVARELAGRAGAARSGWTLQLALDPLRTERGRRADGGRCARRLRDPPGMMGTAGGDSTLETIRRPAVRPDGTGRRAPPAAAPMQLAHELGLDLVTSTRASCRRARSWKRTRRAPARVTIASAARRAPPSRRVRGAHAPCSGSSRGSTGGRGRQPIRPACSSPTWTNHGGPAALAPWVPDPVKARRTAGGMATEVPPGQASRWPLLRRRRRTGSSTSIEREASSDRQRHPRGARAGPARLARAAA
jgi:hypothetical protein